MYSCSSNPISPVDYLTFPLGWPYYLMLSYYWMLSPWSVMQLIITVFPWEKTILLCDTFYGAVKMTIGISKDTCTSFIFTTNYRFQIAFLSHSKLPARQDGLAWSKAQDLCPTLDTAITNCMTLHGHCFTLFVKWKF